MFLTKFRMDPILVSIPFLKPGQSPEPLSLGGPACTTITTALLTQKKQMTEGMKELCKWSDCLTQEAEETEKEKDRMANWVNDLMDQRPDLQGEIHQLEKELGQLEVRKKLKVSSLRLSSPVLPSSVSGLSKGASAGTSIPKRKRRRRVNIKDTLAYHARETGIL